MTHRSLCLLCGAWVTWCDHLLSCCSAALVVDHGSLWNSWKMEKHIYLTSTLWWVGTWENNNNVLYGVQSCRAFDRCKVTQKGNVIPPHRWWQRLAPSPPAISCCVVPVTTSEKSVGQWGFFIKSLGLDFFFFPLKKPYFEYLVQANWSRCLGK